MKVNYKQKQIEERVNAVLSANKNKLNDEGIAAGFLYNPKLMQWGILDDLYNFALEYGVRTDYILGLSDEMR